MQYPDGLRYTKDHEWVRLDGDVATIGITDHAQVALGDVVYVELPTKGARVAQSGQFGTVESVKAVSELYAPVSGEVVDVNAALHDAPETVNASPHEEGWMIKVRISDKAELEQLLDAGAYQRLLGG